MGKVIADITMSLDGLITGPDDRPGRGLGERGECLHNWVMGGPWRYDDEPACQSYARVTIADTEGASARACPRHAIAALDGITCAHVDWADSKGLNEWERKALELSEERNRLG